mmetsp:Transcript_42737/g.92925  ORF Transcript_42737/g.92925 Transcript_42737/m.92925 type:complete len:259 (-) Transcript_42737:39-815(-)
MDHSHGLLDTTPVLAHDGQNPDDDGKGAQDEAWHWLVEVIIHQLIFLLFKGPQIQAAQFLQQALAFPCVKVCRGMAYFHSVLQHFLHLGTFVLVLDHVHEDGQQQGNLQAKVQRTACEQDDHVCKIGTAHEHQQRGVPHGMFKFVGRGVHGGSTHACPVGIVAIGRAHVLHSHDLGFFGTATHGHTAETPFKVLKASFLLRELPCLGLHLRSHVQIGGNIRVGQVGHIHHVVVVIAIHCRHRHGGLPKYRFCTALVRC